MKIRGYLVAAAILLASSGTAGAQMDFLKRGKDLLRDLPGGQGERSLSTAEIGAGLREGAQALEHAPLGRDDAREEVDRRLGPEPAHDADHRPVDQVRVGPERGCHHESFAEPGWGKRDVHKKLCVGGRRAARPHVAPRVGRDVRAPRVGRARPRPPIRR